MGAPCPDYVWRLVGVATIIWRSSWDDGAVFFECGKNTLTSNNNNTKSERIPDLVGVAATTCIASCGHGAVLFQCVESSLVPNDVANTASQLIPELVEAALAVACCRASSKFQTRRHLWRRAPDC